MEEERSGKKERPLLTPTVMLLLLLFPLLLPFLLLVIEPIEVELGKVKIGSIEREKGMKKKKKDATLAEYDDIRVLGNLVPLLVYAL